MNQAPPLSRPSAKPQVEGAPEVALLAARAPVRWSYPQTILSREANSGLRAGEAILRAARA
jgi:hypothetical protein